MSSNSASFTCATWVYQNGFPSLFPTSSRFAWAREGVSPHLCRDQTWFKFQLQYVPYLHTKLHIIPSLVTSPIPGYIFMQNCKDYNMHTTNNKGATRDRTQQGSEHTIAERRRNAKRVDSTPPNGSADGECPERWPQRLPRCSDKRGRLRFKACLGERFRISKAERFLKSLAVPFHISYI